MTFFEFVWFYVACRALEVGVPFMFKVMLK